MLSALCQWQSGLPAARIAFLLWLYFLHKIMLSVLFTLRSFARGGGAHSGESAAAWLARQPHHRQGYPTLPRGVLAGNAHVLWATPASQSLRPWLHHQGWHCLPACRCVCAVTGCIPDVTWPPVRGRVHKVVRDLRHTCEYCSPACSVGTCCRSRNLLRVSRIVVV